MWIWPSFKITHLCSGRSYSGLCFWPKFVSKNILLRQSFVIPQLIWSYKKHLFEGGWCTLPLSCTLEWLTIWKIPFQENKQDTSWNHSVNVYEEDLGMRQVAPGLRKLIKLREDHIRSTPRDRMQVNLAAQVSHLMFNCLLHASL